MKDTNIDILVFIEQTIPKSNRSNAGLTCFRSLRVFHVSRLRGLGDVVLHLVRRFDFKLKKKEVESAIRNSDRENTCYLK